MLLQQLGRNATVRTERSGGRRNRWLLLLNRHRIRRRLSSQESWKTRVLLLRLLLLNRLLLLRYRNGLRSLLSLRLRLRLCVRLRLRLLVIPDLLREITKLFRSLFRTE